MNKKTTYFLSAVFVILLAVATQPYWQKYLNISKFSSSSTTENFIPENLTTITFTAKNQAQPISLQQENGNWLVEGNMVDVRQINELLQDIAQLNFDNIVSENPDNFAQYEATESADTVTVANASGDSTVLAIGTPASQFGFTHIRPMSTEKVYLVRTGIRTSMFKTVDDWRDKTIVAAPSETIDQITVTQGFRSVIIDQDEESRWMATKGDDRRVIGEVSSERLFETLSELSGTGFADDDALDLYQKNRSPLTVDIVYQNDSEPDTMVFIEDVNNSNWLVNDTDSDDILTVSPATVSLIKDNTLTLFE